MISEIKKKLTIAWHLRVNRFGCTVIFITIRNKIKNSSVPYISAYKATIRLD